MELPQSYAQGVSYGKYMLPCCVPWTVSGGNIIIALGYFLLMFPSAVGDLCTQLETVMCPHALIDCGFMSYLGDTPGCKTADSRMCYDSSAIGRGVEVFRQKQRKNSVGVKEWR